jgi:TetR/AcrR family transcriptional regulator, regulator of biofilm formation and stress response
MAPATEAIPGAIVDATIRLVGRGGVDAVTHRAVAAEAGVSLSSTTYHFRSRADIVSAALRRVAALEVAEIARRAHALEAGRPDRRTVARALVAWIAEDVDGERALRARAAYHLQLEAAARPELRAVAVDWSRAIQSLAEDVLARLGSPRPHTDARILATAISGLRLEELTWPRPGAGRRLLPVVERLLAGLTPPDSADPSPRAPR